MKSLASRADSGTSNVVAAFSPFVVSCMISSWAAYGQLSTASINGAVRDCSGGVVPRAGGVLRSIATEVETDAITNRVEDLIALPETCRLRKEKGDAR